MAAHQGEGQHTQTAQLPSFTGTAAPMFEAQGGLNIQIPISEKDVQKDSSKMKSSPLPVNHSTAI